jgi:hypothetical protein
MGININDDSAPWTEWILDGTKIIETRNTNSLKSYINQEVGVIRTGKKRKAMLVGYVTINEPIVYTSKKMFDKDRWKHFIMPRSTFYINKIKYGYPLTNPRRCKERPIKSRGVVSRKIV